MSRASAQVKFPDGTIKYGIYNGTVDSYWEPLFDTHDEAWDAWRDYYSSDKGYDKLLNKKDTQQYEVEIADDYGGGETYKAVATKSQIVSSVDTDDMETIKKGLPDWWSNK